MATEYTIDGVDFEFDSIIFHFRNGGEHILWCRSIGRVSGESLNSFLWIIGNRTLVFLCSKTLVCGFASTSLRSSSKLYFLTEKEHPTAWFLLSG